MGGSSNASAAAQDEGGVEQVLYNGKMWEQGAYNDIERKRMKYIKDLSLAERLGLVDKPPEPLG